MALFNKKDTTSKKPVVQAEKKDEAVLAPVVVAKKQGITLQGDLTSVLKNPRITEKGADGIEARVYLFDVAPNTNKILIRAAIKKVYGVTPSAVHTVTIRQKNVRSARTGKKGVKSGGKKAYVYLKKGDSINLM